MTRQFLPGHLSHGGGVPVLSRERPCAYCGILGQTYGPRYVCPGEDCQRRAAERRKATKRRADARRRAR